LSLAWRNIRSPAFEPRAEDIMAQQTATLSASERADALEHRMMMEMERVPLRSVLFTSGDRDPTGPIQDPVPPGKHVVQGPDPRLKPMPEKPTLMDFFRLRFGSATNHLLQSANLAKKAGHDEKIILACLLHDIGVVGFIRSDHGYWGAQLIAPYVDEEVSWAIRAHQALRFFPDESVGYKYPEMYVRLFGEDFEPEPYIKRDYAKARAHKWYMTARLICVNDLYAFEPGVNPQLEEFTDIIGRNFRQPEEGLGWDDTPASHMWRTIMMPTRAL
jgi:hypothetical protein